MTKETDILIAGGGIAGMTAAAGFAAAGFDVTCVDPDPPVTERDATGADLRSTAFLQPARQFLDEAGLWGRLDAHATPLRVMRIVDAGGTRATTLPSREFDSADLGDQPFGWNLPNWLLRRELSSHLAQAPRVTYRTGVAATGLFSRTGQARVTLSDGSHVTARLVIAADGRNSTLRHAAGIGVRTLRFGQKALAFAVTHPIPHDNVSTEIHLTGGPFTLVPLPDHEGRPSSAVVWMEQGPRAQALHAMDAADFEAEMSARSQHIFGPLTLASNRTIWPIISQVADRLSAQRVALVAEAAHVLPPIGAQGLNMSLTDLRVLRNLAVARPEGLGDSQMLEAYHRARIADIRTRVLGISALNRTSMASLPMLREARALGMTALHDIKPLRQALMRLGLGAT